MAQTNSFSLGNVPGATFRVNLNTIIAALQSTNSGVTAPTATAAGMLWFDTSVSPGILKQRNNANNDWVTLFDDGSVTNAKLADMTTARLKGRVTAGTGAPQDLTVEQVQTMLGIASLTQAQAEDAVSTVFGTVSGQRLSQAIATATAIPAIPAIAGVGSYVWAVRSGTATISFGVTYAGSSLSAAGLIKGGSSTQESADMNASQNGTIFSGTWRAMGHQDSTIDRDKMTLFLRIS